MSIILEWQDPDTSNFNFCFSYSLRFYIYITINQTEKCKWNDNIVAPHRVPLSFHMVNESLLPLLKQLRAIIGDAGRLWSDWQLSLKAEVEAEWIVIQNTAVNRNTLCIHSGCIQWSFQLLVYSWERGKCSWFQNWCPVFGCSAGSRGSHSPASSTSQLGSYLRSLLLCNTRTTLCW